MSDSNVQGALFYFDLMFNGDLNDNHVLVTRGSPDQNGFMQISLVKQNDNRILRMFLKGDDSTQLVVFDSPMNLAADTRH